MNRISLGGLGALTFAIPGFIGLMIANMPGGTYKAKHVHDFVKSGHRPAVFVSVYLVVLGVIGLVLLLARLREAIADPRRASIFWGLGVGSAVGIAAGFGLGAAVPITMGYGGKSVTLDPHVVYVISTAGWVVLSAGGGLLLGAALLTFALGPVAVPAWVRWATLVGGIGGILAFAFFPFVLVPLWALVLGIWLLATDRGRATAARPITAT